MNDGTRALVMGLVVAAGSLLATEARADLVFASVAPAASVSTTSGATIQSGGNNLNTYNAVVMNVSTDSAGIGGTPSVTGQTFVLSVNFPANSTAGNTDLTIFTRNAAAGVNLTQIQWFDAGAVTASKAVAVGIPANTVTRVNTASDLTTYDTVGVGFNPLSINRVDLTFVFSGFIAGGANQAIQFDAISNPEPGTMALFGLGALGLGAMAWRRRKARAAAT